MKPKLIEFKQLGDERGNLVVIEGNKEIPFEPKRVFYIYGSDPDVVRGKHANRRTEFILINVQGNSKVKISDNRSYEEVFVLDKPHIGVLIPQNYWKDMYDFSPGSILLCIASEVYDESEYIRDWDEYLKMTDLF